MAVCGVWPGMRRVLDVRCCASSIAVSCVVVRIDQFCLFWFGLGYTNYSPPNFSPSARTVAAPLGLSQPLVNLMSSVSASGIALPEGWAACIDPTHNVEYYFDLVNNCAQWEFPEAPAALAGGAAPALTSDAANAPDVHEPAAVATPAASDFREAEHHEAAAEEQAPTAAEAAGAQAALGALLDADGEEELLQTAAAAAPYAKAFPAVAEALAAMGLAGLAGEEAAVEEEAEEEAEPAMAVRPSEEASQLFEVSFPEPAASPSRRASWGLERDSMEGTEQGAQVQPLNWTREVKAFSSAELLANMAGAMDGKDSLNGMGRLGAGSVGAAVGQPPPSAPHSEAPAPAAPAAPAAPSMAAPYLPAARPSPVTTPSPAEQSASPTTQIEILSGALRAQEAAQAAAQEAAAQEAAAQEAAAQAAAAQEAAAQAAATQAAATEEAAAGEAAAEAAAQEALRSAEAGKAEPGPFELAAPPSPLKAARAARAARAAEAAEAAEGWGAIPGMGPAPREAPPPAPLEAPWHDEATTPTALPPLPPSVAEGHARPTQTVPHALADAEAQASAPSCEAASETEATACCSASVQTEEAVQAVQAEAAEAAAAAEEEHTAALRQMRAQFVGVRRRCEGLELRLDGEAGVMLKAFRRHQQNLKGLSRRHGALAEHARRGRATLAVRALRAAQQGQLALCWHAWRIHASHACAQRLAPSPPAPAPAPAPTPAPVPASATAPPAPPAAPRIERQELYRMSYEALIDKVLELQENLHAGAGPATSGGGTGGVAAVAAAAAVEAHAVTVGGPGQGAQPPVAEASAKAKGKKKK